MNVGDYLENWERGGYGAPAAAPVARRMMEVVAQLGLIAAPAGGTGR